MKRIVLASNNPGKLREIQALAAGKLELLLQSDFAVPEVEETGLSFVENAILKARHAARHTGLPALADDSGLEVDALHGAPGIRSARYAGPGASDTGNLQKLLQDLADIPEHQRRARFQCVVVYMKHAEDATPIICQGTWEGRILTTPRGENGFGYDPVFYVPTHHCSSAELPPAVKNTLSHRGKALRQFFTALDC
ncbi:MAG TPA: RdgB/HAM1 family non-canonical purine NTP pyrophosphatase [Gammaproteobacteria bacterium]|nr:RdgB/HAM1 family non-canonical purine NTP pyrophosphatase [Gammaproteobacteria bacterium]